MFLITGGLGKIGTIIRNEVSQLKDAKVFDISSSEEQNILHRDAIYAELEDKPYETVIHLAELGQPLLEKGPNKNREVFDVNIRGVKNLIDILRFQSTKIIYTVDMNQGHGHYDRAKRLNTHRLLAHRVSATILPLPEVLPKETVDKPVAPKDLFDLLLKFAFLENDTYFIDRGPEDIIYLGTEDMIALAFEELVVGLEQKEAGVVENDYFIAIKTANFIEMLKRHFPETQILPSPQRRVGKDTELAVEVLEQYFTSLPISALYQAPTVVIEAPTEEVIGTDIPTEDIVPDTPVVQ